MINENQFSKNKAKVYLLSTFVILCFGLTGAASRISLSAASSTQGNTPSIHTSQESPFAAIIVGDSFRNGPTSTYHWYAGGVYNGGVTTTTEALSEFSVPGGAAPKANQFYYVILSIWDNVGSYDQIGFANNNGVWGITYSYTTGTCPSLTYHYNSDAQAITAGKYTFTITIASGGGINFDVYAGYLGTNVYHLTVSNGASDLAVS